MKVSFRSIVPDGLVDRLWRVRERMFGTAPVNAEHDPNYEKWFYAHRATEEELATQRETEFANRPLFSIVVPLFKTPLDLFEDMVRSVAEQTYSNWELVLVNASPEDDALSEAVDSWCAKDARVKAIALDQNYGITENTGRGIKAAHGDYVCFFDHDDVLEPNILFEYASAIEADPEIALLYCDEDKLNPDGTLGCPHFKPDFNIDFLRDNNYVCHMLAVRADLLAKVPPSDAALDGAQDHALTLKIAELGLPFHHVPKVLYHWRMTENSTAGNAESKTYATTAGVLAVQQHLDRLGVDGKVEPSLNGMFRYKTSYAVPEDAKVSVIIAGTGNDAALARTIASVSENTRLDHEFIVVDNSDVYDYICSIDHEQPITLISSTQHSLSEMLNESAVLSSGNYYLFMRCGAEISKPFSLETLVGLCARNDVGAAGAMIVDNHENILQAGIAHVDGNLFAFESGTPANRAMGYFCRCGSTQDVAAVCAICMATSRKTFEEMKGFDTSYNDDMFDIDYCFRVREAGKLVVYNPEAQVVYNCEAFASSPNDSEKLQAKWSEELNTCDAAYNPNLSKDPKHAAHFCLDV